jgi:serine/threonine protein kinase
VAADEEGVAMETGLLLRIAENIAEGLAELHAGKVVCDDLKPSNVLLDENKRAYLTDFGVTRVLHSGLGQTLVTSGGLRGTWMYW